MQKRKLLRFFQSLALCLASRAAAGLMRPRPGRPLLVPTRELAGSSTGGRGRGQYTAGRRPAPGGPPTLQRNRTLEIFLIFHPSEGLDTALTQV